MLSKPVAGFGLVELLVSISIMLLVTTVILVNHSSFTSTSLLRGQAYDMALRIRETQQSAISAQGDTGDFSNVFGIRWQNSERSRYDIFSTPNFEDGLGVDLETNLLSFNQPGILDERFEILCVKLISNMADGCGTKPAIHVVFKRPNFDAVFYDETGERLDVQRVVFVLGQVGDTPTDEAVGTTQRLVTISRSGQISVE